MNVETTLEANAQFAETGEPGMTSDVVRVAPCFLLRDGRYGL
jgi:hypothetical protein